MMTSLARRRSQHTIQRSRSSTRSPRGATVPEQILGVGVAAAGEEGGTGERRRGSGTWRRSESRVVWVLWDPANTLVVGAASVGAVGAGGDEVRPLQVRHVSSG